MILQKNNACTCEGCIVMTDNKAQELKPVYLRVVSSITTTHMIHSWTKLAVFSSNGIIGIYAIYAGKLGAAGNALYYIDLRYAPSSQARCILSDCALTAQSMAEQILADLLTMGYYSKEDLLKDNHSSNCVFCKGYSEEDCCSRTCIKVHFDELPMIKVEPFQISQDDKQLLEWASYLLNFAYKLYTEKKYDLLFLVTEKMKRQLEKNLDECKFQRLLHFVKLLCNHFYSYADLTLHLPIIKCDRKRGRAKFGAAYRMRKRIKDEKETIRKAYAYLKDAYFTNISAVESIKLGVLEKDHIKKNPFSF